MSRKIFYALAASAMVVAAPAAAQEKPYALGSVWEFAKIKIEPGQFENYMTYLAGRWKQVQEFGKKKGVVVSYHVLGVNAARADEPDLILAIEYKDYLTVAQQEAAEKAVAAFLKETPAQMDAGAAGREPMRKQMGSMELQEYKLK